MSPQEHLPHEPGMSPEGIPEQVNEIFSSEDTRKGVIDEIVTVGRKLLQDPDAVSTEQFKAYVAMSGSVLDGPRDVIVPKTGGHIRYRPYVDPETGHTIRTAFILPPLFTIEPSLLRKEDIAKPRSLEDKPGE